MTAIGETEWDAATKAELMPQCELHLAGQGRCPDPAEWIVYSTCRDCDTRFTDLLCVPHSDLSWCDVGCGGCRTYRVYVTLMEAL